MTSLPLDTTVDAHEAQLEVYRRIGGAERVAILYRLGTLSRDTARAGIIGRHPYYDDRQVRNALRRLILGDDLVRKVWPDDDLVEP